jgi:GR25 family glycosyltransferase involved in LPS biosynthesis
MKIFVLHYTKLTDRKKHIILQFEKHNIIDYEFIEKYDKDEINDIYNLKFEKIKLGSASLILKHHYVYKQIVECGNNDNDNDFLILEDDVILTDNFMTILNQYMTQLPKDYDMLFIGDGCNLHIEKDKIMPNKFIYEKCLYPTKWGGDGATRCTDSYVISKKCALTLCNYINNLNYKINLPIDWWLNVAARDNNLKIYWAEPTIVKQGSECGLFNISYGI